MKVLHVCECGLKSEIYLFGAAMEWICPECGRENRVRAMDVVPS